MQEVLKAKNNEKRSQVQYQLIQHKYEIKTIESQKIRTIRLNRNQRIF